MWQMLTICIGCSCTNVAYAYLSHRFGCINVENVYCIMGAVVLMSHVYSMHHRYNCTNVSMFTVQAGHIDIHA